MPDWIQHAIVAVIVLTCLILLIRRFRRSPRHGGKACDSCPSRDRH